MKVGDWVRNNNNEIFQLEELHIWQKDLDFLVKLWQPKEGEWCWFYNSDNYDSVQLTLGKFYGTSSKELKYTYIDMDRQEYSSECCEPFIGELPSFIKDNQ